MSLVRFSADWGPGSFPAGEQGAEGIAQSAKCKGHPSEMRSDELNATHYDSINLTRQAVILLISRGKM